MMQGIFNGMENFSGMLKSLMASIMSSLLTIGIKAILPGSPSKVTTKWGESMMLGLIVVLRDNQAKLEAAWTTTLGTFGPPELQTAPALAGVGRMDPVINVYVDNLFADPQAEARKVGSQVYLREGFTVARESGFNG